MSATQATDISQLVAMMSSFTTRVLTKMDQIVEAQQDLRRLVSANVQARGAVDPLPKSCQTEDELKELCQRLLTDQAYRRQLVSFLSLDGTTTLGRSVRRMLTRVGSTDLWSGYSMRGRKKKSFSDLPLMQVLQKACNNCHPACKTVDVEREVAEFLKHAPFKKGGSGKVGTTQTQGQASINSSDINGPDTPGGSPIDQLDPHLFANRECRGVRNARLSLLDTIARNLDSIHPHTMILFMNFSSAFNTVHIDTLLQQLSSLQIQCYQLLLVITFMQSLSEMCTEALDKTMKPKIHKEDGEGQWKLDADKTGLNCIKGALPF
ncbi:uncharacterized protein LOC134458362 [Engraulis encrasicolus]|uniref:uncharacterized protein LOC134458362 n=1 Tax=Engraulis encrasicolus TaxID=184585 RepID=UPI002FCE984B